MTAVDRPYAIAVSKAIWDDFVALQGELGEDGRDMHAGVLLALLLRTYRQREQLPSRCPGCRSWSPTVFLHSACPDPFHEGCSPGPWREPWTEVQTAARQSTSPGWITRVIRRFTR